MIFTISPIVLSDNEAERKIFRKYLNSNLDGSTPYWTELASKDKENITNHLNLSDRRKELRVMKNDYSDALAIFIFNFPAAKIKNKLCKISIDTLLIYNFSFDKTFNQLSKSYIYGDQALVKYINTQVGCNDNYSDVIETYSVVSTPLDDGTLVETFELLDEITASEKCKIDMKSKVLELGVETGSEGSNIFLFMTSKQETKKIVISRDHQLEMLRCETVFD